MKTAADIRKMSEKEIHQFLAEQRDALQASRFSPTGKKPHERTAAKRAIARACTELRNRTLMPDNERAS